MISVEFLPKTKVGRVSLLLGPHPDLKAHRFCSFILRHRCSLGAVLTTLQDGRRPLTPSSRALLPALLRMRSLGSSVGLRSPTLPQGTALPTSLERQLNGRLMCHWPRLHWLELRLNANRNRQVIRARRSLVLVLWLCAHAFSDWLSCGWWMVIIMAVGWGWEAGGLWKVTT